MRYPVQLIPGLPVVPDVGIGVQLTPVVPVAAAGAAAGGSGGSGDTNAYWAFSPTDSAELTIVRGDDAGGNATATTTPPDAYVDIPDDYNRQTLFMVVAVVRNVPDGAAVTWDIPTPTFNYGDSPSVSGSADDLYFSAADPQYRIRVDGAKVECWFCYPLSLGSGYGAWALNPVTLTPSVDGTPLRTLTLNVSALAFGGF